MRLWRWFFVSLLFVLRSHASGCLGLYGFEDQIEVLRSDPRIAIIHSFLTDEECDHLIQRAYPYLQRSEVVFDELVDEALEQIHPGRTSSGMFLERRSKDPVIWSLERKIEKLTHVPESHSEGLQILRYCLGEKYTPHYDFFDKNTPGGAACCSRGGQRIATLIIYLSDVEKGGETVFPKERLAVAPIKGDALIFFNCTADGKEDVRSLHGSFPVLAGEKWVAVKWLREGVFE